MTTQKVQRALADLPDTAEEIAAWLQLQGYRGRRASIGECPVARYLTGSIGTRVLVGHNECSVSSLYAGEPDKLPPLIPLPAAVSTFVRSFDAGAFPDLVAHP